MLEPSLHLEINNAGELTFSVLPNHPLYNQIHKMRSFVTVFQDDEELFYGRVLSTTKDLFGKLDVTCEGALTFLLDSELEKLEVTETVEQFFARCITEHNSQVEEAKRFTLGEVSVGKLSNSEFHTLSESLQTRYYSIGNVDLLHRPQIPAADMIAAGWDEVEPGSISTIYSSAYFLGPKQEFIWGHNSILHMTPIKANGEVLSPLQLDSYVETLLEQETAQALLSYDNNHNKLVLWLQDVPTTKWDKPIQISTSFDDTLSRLQAAYYLEEYDDFPSEKELRGFNEDIFAPELNGAKANEKMEFKIENYSTIKSALESFFIQKHGGYFRVRPNPNGPHFLDYVSQYGIVNNQRIRIAENIVDKSDDISGQNIFTLLRPVGKNGLTIGSVNPSKISLPNVTKDGNKLVLNSLLDEYGYITHSESFSDIDDDVTLLRAAEDFIKRRGSQLPSTCDISFVDFHLLNPEIQRVAVGDIFTDIEGFYGQEMTVSSRDLDLANPGNDSMILGNREELASSDAGSSSGTLSASYASKCAHYDYIYKHIKETVENDKELLILHADEIDLLANTIESRSQFVHMVVEPDPSGESGKFVLRARKFRDGKDRDEEDSQLIMTLGNVEIKNAGLKVDGYVEVQSFHAGLEDLESQLRSSLDVTASQIRAEVSSSDSILYSKIVETESQIRSEVGNAVSGLYSSIEQTASQVRSEVHASSSELYSSITQTASQIRAEVGDSISGLNAALNVTASQIRAEVSASNSLLSSSLEATASQIRSEVSNSISGVKSSITQTASQIRSEVRNSTSTIYSSINQTASQIRSEVSNAISGVQSSITEQADRISLVVSGTGTNAKIRPAQIVAAINNGASSVVISADHINLNGYVKATDITADLITSKLIGASIAGVNYLYSSGVVQAGSGLDSDGWLTVGTTMQVGGNATIGGSLTVNQKNVLTSVSGISLSSEGNVYTLSLSRLNGTTEEIGNFSRAVSSWSRVWANGQITVTVQPQNQSQSWVLPGANWNIIHLSGTEYMASCTVAGHQYTHNFYADPYA